MAIPLPLRGIDVSLVRLTIQTLNATTGALTDSATVGTITSVLDGAGIRKKLRSEEISAITSPRENNVPLQVGTEIVLREILDRRASALPTTGPILAKLADTLGDPAGSAFCKVEISRGANTWTYKGLFDGYDEGPYVRGKNTAELRLVPIDDGSSSPTYT
ncbi:MAG TPA: hypothetical protein VGP44_07225 [Gemmatimonadales bacterium]|nr:hypothetical protein [Gemmatimonadales bacterium]